MCVCVFFFWCVFVSDASLACAEELRCVDEMAMLRDHACLPFSLAPANQDIAGGERVLHPSFAAVGKCEGCLTYYTVSTPLLASKHRAIHGWKARSIAQLTSLPMYE